MLCVALFILFLCLTINYLFSLVIFQRFSPLCSSVCVLCSELFFFHFILLLWRCGVSPLEFESGDTRYFSCFFCCSTEKSTTMYREENQLEKDSTLFFSLLLFCVGIVIFCYFLGEIHVYIECICECCLLCTIQHCMLYLYSFFPVFDIRFNSLFILSN